MESVVIPEAECLCEVEPTARALADEADSATYRVAAEQRALRAAKHFYSFQIQQITGKALAAAKINATEIDGHGAIAAYLRWLGLHDAAHRDITRTRAAERSEEVEEGKEE